MKDPAAPLTRISRHFAQRDLEKLSLEQLRELQSILSPLQGQQPEDGAGSLLTGAKYRRMIRHRVAVSAFVRTGNLEQFAEALDRMVENAPYAG